MGSGFLVVVRKERRCRGSCVRSGGFASLVADSKIAGIGLGEGARGGRRDV